MDRSCPLQNAQPWGAKLKATRAISPSHGSCMVLLRGSSWKYSIKNCLVVGTVAVRSRADGDQEQAQSTEPVVLEGGCAGPGAGPPGRGRSTRTLAAAA